MWPEFARKVRERNDSQPGMTKDLHVTAFSDWSPPRSSPLFHWSEHQWKGTRGAFCSSFDTLNGCTNQQHDRVLSAIPSRSIAGRASALLDFGMPSPPDYTVMRTCSIVCATAFLYWLSSGRHVLSHKQFSDTRTHLSLFVSARCSGMLWLRVLWLGHWPHRRCSVNALFPDVFWSEGDE